MMDERVEGVLRGCGLVRHAEAMRRERISWDALMELEEPDLVSLGLTLGKSFLVSSYRSA
jgi:hypothetical protein